MRDRLRPAECAAIRAWAAESLAQGDAYRIASFDWPRSDGSILFYAAMMVFGPDGHAVEDHDRALYEAIAQRTHYVLLDELAEGIAFCFSRDVDIETDDDGRRQSLRSTATWGHGSIDVYWSRVDCGFGLRGCDPFQGCASIRVRRE